MNIVFHKNFKKKPFDEILNNHALTGDRHGYRSINITGDLRALFSWVEKDTVLFTDIDTHSNLYSK